MASIATAASFKPPTIRITAVKYHNSKLPKFLFLFTLSDFVYKLCKLLVFITHHNIIADASESLTKLVNDLKANQEKPFHASGKQPDIA